MNGIGLLMNGIEYDVNELAEMWKNMRETIMDEYVLKGNFTLSSGQRSDLYVDIKSATTEHLFMRNVIPLLEDRLRKIPREKDACKCLAGLESGAISLLTGLQLWYNWNIVWVRKEKRDHGITDPVVGFMHDDDKWIIVEDVIMTGAGINKVANAVGVDRVLGVVCVVNRSNLGDRINLTDAKTFEEKVVDIYALYEMKHFSNYY